MLISLILGVLVAAVLGLTGAGGGILAVPALVAGLGWSMQHAAPVALIAVAGGAGIAAIGGFRRKLVRYRAAALMAVAGIPVFTAGLPGAVLPTELTLLFTAATAAGMLIGRYASHRLSVAHVQVGFAVVLLVVALGLFVKAALNI